VDRIALQEVESTPPGDTKKDSLSGCLFSYQVDRRRLFLFDGALRADTGASAAVDTGVRIDFVDVTGGDGTHRALIDAGTASNAIFSDFVSHG
jgi:hypothetical protein